jgi:ribosomal protein S18 acetylase RimI-like enzyme
MCSQLSYLVGTIAVAAMRRHTLTGTMSPSISTVADAHKERAIGTIMTAFTADPALRWVLPDPQQYLTHGPEFVRRFCGRAFDNQSAFVAEGFMGAALWLPPGVDPDGEGIDEWMNEAVPEEKQSKVSAFFDEMDKYHPHEPIWYLAMIGVDPARQGMGLGSALLAHALAAVDREAKPAYLEATTESSRDLYARHGFEVIGTIQAADSPPMFPMVRKAR